MRILFFGTPDFAIPTLMCLQREHDVVGVVTATDKSQGRGHKIVFSPVKQYALQCKLPILQPEKLKNKDFLNTLDDINADLYIVVGFRYLPEEVWSKPKFGTINLHASLLPDYKGAAPINWAIINGERLSGVSTFFINSGIDTGDLIYQDVEKIYSCDTFDTLKDRLKILGAKLMIKTIKSIEDKDVVVHKQDVSNVTHLAPKIEKDFCQINWSQSAKDICSFINGLSETPCAFTFINGRRYKIYYALPFYCDKIKNGEMWTDKKSFLYIGTKDGVISIEEIKPEGRKKMNIREFLAGYIDKI